LGGEIYSAQLFFSISLAGVLGFYFWQVHAETLGSHFGRILPGLQRVHNFYNIGGGFVSSVAAGFLYKATGGAAPLLPVIALCAVAFSCNFANDASKRDDIRSPWLWFLTILYMILLLGGISVLDTLLATYPATATFLALVIALQQYRILLREDNIRARNAQGVQGLADLSRQYRAKGTILEPKTIAVPEPKPGEKRQDFLLRCAWFERFGGGRLHLRSMIGLSLLAAIVSGWGGALLWSGSDGIHHHGLGKIISNQIIRGEHGYMLSYLTMLAVVAMAFMCIPRLQTSIIYPVEALERQQVMQRAIRQTWALSHIVLLVILLMLPMVVLQQNTFWVDSRPSFSLIIFLLSAGLMPFAQRLALWKAETWGIFDGLAVKTSAFAIWFVILIAFSLGTTFGALSLNYIANEGIAKIQILIPLALIIMLGQCQLFRPSRHEGRPSNC
jgi:hypothetical protein